jgi:hypothetical protein
VKRAAFSLALALFIVAAYAVPVSTLRLPVVHAQWSNPRSDVPPYHNAPPAPGQALPPILHGSQLSGPYFQKPWQIAVYKEAAQIPDVLYQLPCLCGCERALGHTSLHSCFEGTHGAVCGTCAAEEAYAYQMTRRGWTVQQIRTGIEHHAYESIDLSKLGHS